jgi:hypothetical protein
MAHGLDRGVHLRAPEPYRHRSQIRRGPAFERGLNVPLFDRHG